MTSLLQDRERKRLEDRIALQEQVRHRLKAALHQRLPGQKVWVFGSLMEPGRFGEGSDVDVAIEALPEGMSLYTLTALLEEDLGRPVDVIYLPESRLREKILNTGQLWIG